MDTSRKMRFAGIVFAVGCMLLSCTDILNPPTPGKPPVGGTTNGYFKIGKPGGGVSLTTGDTNTINWSNSSSPPADSFVRVLLYSNDTLVRTISSYRVNSGSYAWTVSAPASGSRYRIRIQSYSDSSKYDFGSYFTIKSQYNGTISVTRPLSTDTLQSGSSFTVRWTTTGTVGSYVTIALFSDTSYVASITSSVSTSAGSYTWSLSNSYAGSGSRYRVRVSSYYDAGISAYSGYFTIRSQYDGSYALTNPTATSAWSAGSTYSIQWTTTGTPGSTVRIQLYNDTSLFSSITSGSTDYGSYSWSVPSSFPTGSKYRIRISSYYDQGIQAYSGYFTIAGVVPDTFEPDNSRPKASSLTLGTPQNRTLHYNDTDWIAVQLETGVSYTFASGGTTGTGVYVYYGDSSSYSTYFSGGSGNTGFARWTCARSGKYNIRVLPYSSGYGGAYSFSVAAYDSILRSTFTAPDSQTVWSAGSSYQIQWTPDTVLFGRYVYLYLWDGTGKTTTTITSSVSNTGVYSWTIPTGLPTRSTYRIKMVNYNASAIYGYGPQFTISGVTPDTFELDDSLSRASAIPVDGSVQSRSLYRNDVDWVRFPVQKDSLYVVRMISTVQPYLYLYPGRDSSYLPYRSGNSVVQFWKATSTTTAYLRIVPYSTSYYGAYTLQVRKADESTVVPFINPTSGSTWSGGTQYSIQWTPDTASFGTSVALSLYREQMLVENINSYVVNGQGTCTWTVPAGLASGSRYRIKMISTNSSSGAYAFSPWFTISGITPDAYEIDDSVQYAKTLPVDSTIQTRNLTRTDIDWASVQATAGKLYLIQIACSTSTNLKLYGGDGSSLITSATGTYTVPARIVWFCTGSGTYFVNISSSIGGSYSLSAKGYDSTQFRLTVSAPAVGSIKSTASADTIRWSAPVNAGGYVDVFLYKGTTVVQTVIANTFNDGEHVWTVPTASAGSDYSIRVINRTNAAIQGSSGLFTIQP